MQTVWKSTLELTDHSMTQLPKGSEVIHVAMQHGQLTIWYKCDSEAPRELRQFRICVTGHPLDEPRELVHRGSVFDGPFVWHVFEKV